MELVVAEALRGLADVAEPGRVPLPVGLGDGRQGVLADPPVAGQRVAGEQVEGGGLAVGLGRALRRHLGEVDGGEPGAADVEGGGREHHRPVAGERGEDADEGLGDGLAARAVSGVPYQPLHGGLAHRGEQVAQNRHGVALRPRRRLGIAGLEQELHHVPPERALGKPQAGDGDRRVHVRVPARRVGVRLAARHPVGAERIGARQRRPDQLAHPVRHARVPGRRHHETEQVGEEGALGRQRGAAAELGVAGVDGVFIGHAEGEPAGLVAARRRQGFPHQRDQPRRGRADVDDGTERQLRLAFLEGEGQAQGVHQHRLALSRQAVDQLEAVVAALVRRERQGLAVGRAEQVARARHACPRHRAQRRRAADRHEAERLGQRRQRRFRRGAAAEAGDRGRKTLQGIAGERGERGLAPALGDLLHAAETGRQRARALLRRDPGEQPETEPHDRLGVGAHGREIAQRVPAQQAVRGREREKRRHHARHGGVEPVQAATLDEEREAAGESGGGQARHQLREGPRMAGAEAHVERAVEAVSDADAGTDALGLADQELRRQWRREGAGLGRLRHSRQRVVGGRHRTPVRRR